MVEKRNAILTAREWHEAFCAVIDSDNDEESGLAALTAEDKLRAHEMALRRAVQMIAVLTEKNRAKLLRSEAMRRAAKIDANHTEVKEALLAIGCTVRSLASVGDGIPDLLVGFRGMTILIEVKDGRLPPSHRRLTDDELAFFNSWGGGPVFVVLSPEDAVRKVLDASQQSRKSF